MKETGIIMSGDHPRLILDGIKTQTRRVIKGIDQECDGLIDTGSNHWQMQWRKNPDKPMLEICNIHCPYGQVGDRLWVRETWRIGGSEENGYFIEFKADNKQITISEPAFKQFEHRWLKWNSSRFMPRWASRILLEITEIRAERVQEISYEDCYLEGIDRNLPTERRISPVVTQQVTPKTYFKELWDSLNAKRGYGWDRNNWVFPISFRLV